MRVSGYMCEQTGTYRGRCECNQNILIAEGMFFPLCAVCQREVSWLPNNGGDEVRQLCRKPALRVNRFSGARRMVA